MARSSRDDLVSGLARKAGVNEEDAAKVLKALGIDKVLTNVKASAGMSKLASVKVGDLKLAVRLGRSSVSV